jgi:ABC-type nitrate/sulfonate/bicarbonate transport system substrate-binding protein
MQRRGILIALVLVAAGCGGSAGAAGQAGSDARPLQQLTLQLDWYPNPDHVGVYVAIDRGFFARAGLAVKPIAPSSVSDAIKLVAAGRVDLGISYEPELFFAQQQHIPVAAVAAVVPTALNSVIGRRDRGITSVAGLRGKTIGVDGSSSTSAYLSTVLRIAWSPWLSIVDDNGRPQRDAELRGSCLQRRPGEGTGRVSWVELDAAQPGDYRIEAPYAVPRGTPCAA